MNLLVLMAGSSQSFYNEGYKYPKPLIEINGEMIVNKVVSNIKPLSEKCNKVVFVIMKEDDKKYHLSNIINLLIPEAIVIELEKETAGAACSALLATEHLDASVPLIISNGDHVIDEDLTLLTSKFIDGDSDGGVLVFNSVHPRWSYVRLSNDGSVIEASEKMPISSNATAGFYFFRQAKDFSIYAQKMILKGAHTNGAYYVCPTFNEMILDYKNITSIEINSNNYHSFMSPDLIEEYKKSQKK